VTDKISRIIPLEGLCHDGEPIEGVVVGGGRLVEDVGAGLLSGPASFHGGVQLYSSLVPLNTLGQGLGRGGVRYLGERTQGCSYRVLY